MNELLANRATLSKRGNDVLLQCEDREHAAAVLKYIEGVEVEMQQLREENAWLKDESQQSLRTAEAALDLAKERREETERLQAENQGYRYQLRHVTSERDDILSERNQLSEENERLKAAIRFALNKCVSRDAGNWKNPFAYLWTRDWKTFEGMAEELGIKAEDEG